MTTNIAAIIAQAEQTPVHIIGTDTLGAVADRLRGLPEADRDHALANWARRQSTAKSVAAALAPRCTTHTAAAWGTCDLCGRPCCSDCATNHAHTVDTGDEILTGCTQACTDDIRENTAATIRQRKGDHAADLFWAEQ